MAYDEADYEETYMQVTARERASGEHLRAPDGKAARMYILANVPEEAGATPQLFGATAKVEVARLWMQAADRIHGNMVYICDLNQIRALTPATLEDLEARQ
jgi:hypothetical protein